ncbi:hypothetical protein BGZ92_007115, partial [Podila epicladia]
MNVSTSSASAQTTGSEATSTSEVIRIFSNAIQTNALPAEDRRYVAQLVSQRTGIAQADAEKRVTATFDKVQAKLKEAEVTARESADKLRKASSYAALWLSVSLLSGAFFASSLKDHELVPEATVEHATLKNLIAQVKDVEPHGEIFDAKIKVLSEYVKHHVKEEQNEMFPKVEASKLDMIKLGAQMAARKEELM